MERPYLLHALSPLHAGTGHSADLIDLPIARIMGMNVPIAPGSGVKGVLRDARTPKDLKERTQNWQDRHWATFGPETTNAAEHAGALVVGDARLLALPVRSFTNAFAWVTSPLLLTLAKRDLIVLDERQAGEWSKLKAREISARRAKLTAEAFGDGGVRAHDGKVYLQDLDLETDPAPDPDLAAWAAKLAGYVSPGADIFTKRFVAVDDDTMAFLWETATQIDQRIRIDHDTGVVVDGALWREESLPPETLLIGLMEAGPSRRKIGGNGGAMGEKDVLDFALPKATTLQFGGKATVGRGRCRIIPIDGAAAHAG